MPETNDSLYRFSPFALHVQRRLLVRDGNPVPLTSKAFDILLLLIERREEVIDKNDLLEAVWPKQAVEESNLTVHISGLRKALGERSGDHKYVITVPGRGYKFAAPVLKSPADGVGRDEPVSESTRAVGLPGRRGTLVVTTVAILTTAALGWIIGPRNFMAGSPPRTLAVLPFRSLVAQNDGGLLELGLADMVVTKLSYFNELVLRPTSSVRKYTAADRDPLAAGRELGVEAVVDGTVHRVDNRIRVTVRLLRVPDGTALWAGHFDEAYDDVLKVEDAISDRVAGALRVGLAPARATHPTVADTRNPEAHRLYLIGRFHWNKMNADGWRTSIDYFGRALELDREYALAYAGMAAAYVSLASDASPAAEEMEKARRAATAALQLDESVAEAHISLGLVKAYYDWDWEGAGREFNRAVDLKPNSPDAHRERGLYLATVGQCDEAIAETRKAHQLDPISPVTSFAVGWSLVAAHRYEDAISHFQKVREIDPQSAAAFSMTGVAQLGTKRFEDAAVSFNQAASLYPDNLALKAELAFAYGRAGKRSEAEEILSRLREQSKNRYVSPYYFALVYAGLGDDVHAFEWLDRAYRDRSRRLWALNVVPMWENLRSDARFRQLLQRINLP